MPKKQDLINYEHYYTLLTTGAMTHNNFFRYKKSLKNLLGCGCLPLTIQLVAK